jgi:outer membrane protein assembly factor BamE (lipoprotein component of BamABCDE complex)
MHYRNYFFAACIFVIATVLTLCFLPREIYRFRYGRPLLTTAEYLESYQKVKNGMTFEEVRNAIGDPHEMFSNHDGSTSWSYYVPSSFSPIEDGLFTVEFDAKGRMTSYWIP